MRKKQDVVELSTTKAQYMATTHARNEVVWLKTLCSGIGLVQFGLVVWLKTSCKDRL
jgi:hypothetical protein